MAAGPPRRPGPVDAASNAWAGQDTWMACGDGVRLATRIWMPAGEGPWPVLLMRQPYGRAIASTVTYAHPRWYAAQGFVVVVQDVRGRGDSEGRFMGFGQEAADGATAVRWCRSLPGSSGRVGTYGFSYQGMSQLLIAPEHGGTATGERGDPLPDCLAPAMCGPDERLHWAGEGGAHWWSLGVGWALQLAAEGCRRRGDRAGWGRIRRSLESGAYLEEGLELLEELDPGGMGLAWLVRDPAQPQGWRDHHLTRALLRRPMLLIGGWHDPHLAGTLEVHRRSLKAGGRPQLCIGAWSHLDWRGGVDRLQVRFFRRHLGCRPGPASGGTGAAASPGPGDPAPAGLGRKAPGEGIAPMALQCLRSGSWWHEDAPAEQALRGWHLATEGLAAIRNDAGELRPLDGEGRGEGGLTLVHDPWRPVPSRGGHLGPDPGLVERRDLDRRGDVACFRSAPLGAPLRLLGRPVLRIRARADQPGFDLWASLSVLRDDGAAVQLCTGVRRVLGQQALDGVDLEVHLQPLAVQLAAGERLGLSLAGAAWPAIAVNPGDGSLPRAGSGPDHRIIAIDLDLADARLWIARLVGAN